MLTAVRTGDLSLKFFQSETRKEGILHLATISNRVLGYLSTGQQNRLKVGSPLLELDHRKSDDHVLRGGERCLKGWDKLEV